MSQNAVRLKNFLPYLLTRAVFALVICWEFGPTLAGAAAFLLLCGGFVLYLKSGWFHVDPNRPLAPLSRDERGQWAQYQALLRAVQLGLLAWATFEFLLPGLSLGTSAGHAGFQVGMLSYFAVQFYYLQFT
ncbi:MAG: hypothetical protein AAGA81_15465 [Acidobacteriota bacterium]